MSSLQGDEVVISGISGVFPSSDNVVEFMENLYNKVDMVTYDDGKMLINNPDIPKHMGRIKGAEKFDAQFFRVTFNLARVLEPMGKKLLEHAYGAIFDSGTSVSSLKGKKLGVFVGSEFSDISVLSMYDVERRSDFIINGNSLAMLANRISYWIDGKGPSYSMDCACSSSIACLVAAYHSIKNGQCDAAIVGGCNLCVDPTMSYNLRRTGLLCMDGKTKCFDKNGDGYVRADAINVLFLQKAKDANRIYAQVYHSKGNYKMSPDAEFLPLRKSDDIEHFLNEVYSETDLNPRSVEYVEAHGAAIANADKNELEAIGNIFAKDSSIKVGSVKSNMGNSESASGVCAITKLCLAYQKGKLPANLHYNEPLDIPAVCDRRVQVVTEHEAFGRGFTAVNSFSRTGTNFHVILKGLYKEKDLGKYKSNIPHIVLVSGRQEACVQNVFDSMKTHPIDAEEIGLLRKVFEHDIPGHTGRGYTILDQNETDETISVSESVDYYSGVKKPLWFLYSGMGSQWAGMGAGLMKIPTFATAIQKYLRCDASLQYVWEPIGGDCSQNTTFEGIVLLKYRVKISVAGLKRLKCHKVLEPKGIDLIKIVTELDNSIFDNIINAFVGIGAVQIGLTDVIKEMGIVPDRIIGHSLGEMACAYHDDTFTAEELILSTYHRARACSTSSLIKGSMAAIGLGYKEIVKLCPPEIDVACHNSYENATISGPADVMKKFVSDLSSRGVFAREVPSANIAYHSRYIAPAGDEVLRRLRYVIKNPKLRSSKWISTSVPQEKWGETNAKFSSAEYHTNNLLSPVLFEEMSAMIPDNAIVVEIAPHGLMQAILKRSHKECTHIPLTRRGNKDGVKFFLDAIGKLYQAGVNPKVEVLYPKIEFPVSTETPLLSQLVEWEHSEDWSYMSYLKKEEKMTAAARNIVFSTHDDEYKFLEGYVRNGINILPESAIIVLIWETLGMHMGVNYKDQSVVFQNIHFHSQVIIRSDAPLRLSISFNRLNNSFEVSQEDTQITSGVVSGVKILKFLHKVAEFKTEYNLESDEITLTSEDIYTILDSRGYSYNKDIQSIRLTNLNCKQAHICWNNNWVLFLDALIQLNNLARNYEGHSIPKFINKLRINVQEQKISETVDIDGVECYTAEFNDTNGIVRCAGVEICDLTFVDKAIVDEDPDILKNKAFYPYYRMDKIDLKTALRINLEIIHENTMKEILFICNKKVYDVICDIASDIPNLNIDLFLIETDDDIDRLALLKECSKINVFFVENVLGDNKKLNILQNLQEDCYIIVLETEVPKLQPIIQGQFTVITSMSDGKRIQVLLKKKNIPDVSYIYISFNSKFEWVSRVYEELQKTKRVVLVSERQPYCGALGLVKKLKSDGFDKISLFAIDDYSAPSFNPNIEMYKEQLAKNLTINILKKGGWGGYYYTPCASSTRLNNFALISSVPGDLDSLKWIEAPRVPASINLVQVSYSGLTLKDLDKAVGRNNKTAGYGMDFSGIDIHGERVMGLVAGNCLASTVESDSNLLWPVPSHWTLQDAATIPLAYSLAYYCLTIKGQLLKNQTVLVTGGAGALGQAIISICISQDCTVFTTVSSAMKKKFLLRLFPKLDENKIGYSRDESCMDFVKCNLGKKGINFVINSTSGNMRQAAMSCVGHNGCFLDLNDYDARENKPFSMSYLNKDRTYLNVDLSNIFKQEEFNVRKALQKAIAEGMASGIVRPISRLEYAPTDIHRAFRLLSSSTHAGKLLIKMRSPDIMNEGLYVSPRMTYCSKGVYIVICDKNGIGIELADRLVKKGARNIVMHVKEKVSGYFQSKLLTWQKYNTTIRISTENINIEKGCIKLINDAIKLGPIIGIFIVQNSENITVKDSVQHKFANKFNDDAMEFINLDLTSKQYCKDLNHFVVLTTSPKTDSDAYTLSLIEKVCEGRSEIGLPSLILRTDSVEHEISDKQNPNSKVQPQTLSAFFNAMEKSLKLKYRSVLTFNLNKAKVNGYLEKLSQVLGVKDIESLQSNIIIDDLKLNEVVLEELRIVLEKCRKVSYPVEKIRCMTIENLKNLENDTRAKSKSINGLEAFYKCIDDETQQLEVSHPIVPMITLLNNGIDNDLDPKGTYLTLIPGFEGRYQTFTSAVERLKVQAVTVQLAPDMEGNSIPEIAATVRKFMKTKFETKSKFYLLGYSFGVNVALELAALLEKEGHVGVVYCLDSSPDILKVQLNAYLGNITESQIQNVVAAHITSLISENVVEGLKQELEKLDDWSNKVDICLRRLRNVASYSKQYTKAILESAYQRIMLALKYEPEYKLNSDLVLIKGLAHPNADEFFEDYNLSKYTKKPIKIFHLESDHTEAPYDLNLPNFVNRMLDPKILDDFKKANLCEKYLVKSRMS